jgi:hypothetical protein
MSRTKRNPPPAKPTPIGNREVRTVPKAPWHLLPYDALAEVVKVMAYGKAKYAARNWEKGLQHDETFGATMRHLTAWYAGEDVDTESGLLHLAHVAWNALALLAFTVRGRDDLDNRRMGE